MRKFAALSICVAALTAGTGAVQTALDARAVNEAIAIGQSTAVRERARFHAAYRIPINRAPIDYVEVITPFRRIVLEAESRAAVGDRTFGQRRGLELLGTGPLVIELLVEMTFHPLNTFVGVPDYRIALTENGSPPLRPRAIDRFPRHEPRVDGAPRPGPNASPLPTGQPLVGGAMVARFDAQLLQATGVYEVVIEEGGKELARARADFAKMR
jgi:hypothetical protein